MSEKDATVGVNEIADKLGRTPRTVRRWHAEGKLQSFQAGGKRSHIRMRVVDLQRLIKKRGA